LIVLPRVIQASNRISVQPFLDGAATMRHYAMRRPEQPDRGEKQLFGLGRRVADPNQ
jgi:hypothetical protein